MTTTWPAVCLPGRRLVCRPKLESTIRAFAMRCICAVAALTLVMSAALGVASAQDRVINVYNWSDYIDPAVLEDFTKQTGIKVQYDTFDTNERMENKLMR